ncbi:MAG: tail fiber protein [Sphingopyxis sp.]|uniref:phage tail protein n=1 Tax=Sphingopyxis sp. TaxID=1908224 RepID=UPI002ABC88BA|nr:tail fiber protein [Sphingopyxis sp.]MDZ3832821.1 tail fiber protein [Sphingopyxis sp.]
MADPYIGEVRIFGFNYAPYQWATCDGTLIPIQQNTALYSLMGTSFGGDGRTTFALPNLASRQPCGIGNGPGLTARTLGESFGVQQVTLTTTEIPPHNHGGIRVWEGGSAARTAGPTPSSALSGSDNAVGFGTPTNTVQMSPMAIGVGGGSSPHPNQQPVLAVNFSIALYGIFPSFS